MPKLVQFARSLQGKYFYFICYADPPTLSDTRQGPMITTPHSWTSRAVERAVGVKWEEWDNNTPDGCVVGASWDERGGLMIAAKIRSNQIFSIAVDHVQLNMTSVCAVLEYYSRDRGLEIDTAELTGMIRVEDAGGCNPGGQVYFPYARQFSHSLARMRGSTMFENSRAKWYLWRDRVRPDNIRVRRHFPDIDFSGNYALEKLINMGSVRDQCFIYPKYTQISKIDIDAAPDEIISALSGDSTLRRIFHPMPTELEIHKHRDGGLWLSALRQHEKYATQNGRL